tara:strand:- start:60 stop:410 length:351 start_codon:yes stop_codon:yes gene_type:complete
MAKTFKQFLNEYAMGLQVPATSYLKPTASMKLKKKEDYDRDDEVSGKKLFKPAKHMPKDSGGKIDLDEPTRKGSPLKKAKKVDAKPKDGSDHTQPSTKYKGLAPGFVQKVPNYVDG